MAGLDGQKLAAAKLWLISPSPGNGPVGAEPSAPRDLPYLATALYALVAVANEDVARMTCDEYWRIYVNPAWLDAAPVPAVGAELAHVVWHLLADHSTRARDQDVDKSTAVLWDECADVTISHTLEPDSLRPSALATFRTMRVPEGLSAEEYFALKSGLSVVDSPDSGTLQPGEGCGSGADGIPRSHEHGPSTDIGAVTFVEARAIRERVAIEAREHSTKRGDLPGDLERWIQETLHPRIPWQPLLSGAVRRGIGWAAGRGDYTYQRPSRRASSVRGVVLPGQHRQVPRVSIIIDTSGSVDDELLSQALGEVDGAIASLGLPGSHVSVYSVDAAAHLTQRVRRARDAQLIGAGGTDLRVGLKAIEHERPRPDVVVVLTDGYTPWPATPPPGSAVIVALLAHRWWGEDLPETPEWATRVECMLD